jgi:hypothetical protein
MSCLKKSRATLLNKGVLLGAISLLAGSAAMGNPILQSNRPIRIKYSQLGGAQGFLGKPTAEERSTPDGGGKFRHFESGSIYWHPQTGAHEVHGDIRVKWSELGWEKSFLGYPTTDETATPDKVGRFNHFQGGSIYWHPKTGAHEVHGKIREKWAALGWEKSFLGYPTTDETATPDKVGRFNHFQGGSIYWHPQTGVRVERGKSSIPAPPKDDNLPNPQLTEVKRESYEANGKMFLRYSIPVTNWQSFPDELFAAAPHLPPCGLNKEASRTWVDIFDQTGNKLYGFCALGSAKELENLWFAVERGKRPPEYVYIILKDRQRNKTYKSNRLIIAKPVKLD